MRAGVSTAPKGVIAGPVLPRAPRVPASAYVGVPHVLWMRGEHCLVRSYVRQAWLTAQGDPRELVIGTTGVEGFAAHAWLSGEDVTEGPATTKCCAGTCASSMSQLLCVLHLDGRPVEPAAIEQLTDVMADLGPDGRGIHVDGPLGIRPVQSARGFGHGGRLCGARADVARSPQSVW